MKTLERKSVLSMGSYDTHDSNITLFGEPLPGP